MSTLLFKKLNFKNQKEILVLNSPTEFEPELNNIREFTNFVSDIHEILEIEFVLVFVKTRAEVDLITPIIDQKLKGDGIVWFAYPKGTSKKYKSEINRDHGWNALGKADFEAVRQIAIDVDWSALRFRKVAFIKTMKRSQDFAMTKEGKRKTTG